MSQAKRLWLTIKEIRIYLLIMLVSVLIAHFWQVDKVSVVLLNNLGVILYAAHSEYKKLGGYEEPVRPPVLYVEESLRSQIREKTGGPRRGTSAGPVILKIAGIVLLAVLLVFVAFVVYVRINLQGN